MSWFGISNIVIVVLAQEILASHLLFPVTGQIKTNVINSTIEDQQSENRQCQNQTGSPFVGSSAPTKNRTNFDAILGRRLLAKCQQTSLNMQLITDTTATKIKETKTTENCQKLDDVGFLSRFPSYVSIYGTIL